MEVKNEYTTEQKEQHDQTSQIDKVKVYIVEQRLPNNYSKELYVWKRLMTL